MKFYFTFGQVHVHSVNGKTLDKDSIGVIYSDSYEHARELAFEWFGDKFHNQYSEKTWSDDKLAFFPRGLIEINPPVSTD